MKHIFRIIVLAVALVSGLTTVTAQNVHVDVRQKVRILPITATNYLDDPFRYFEIQLYVYDVGSEGVDVFFDIDFSLNEDSFYIRTKPGTVPAKPIHLFGGLNNINRDELLDQLRGGRKETNVDLSNPLNAQLLPEGTYQLRLDVYLWEALPGRVKVSDDSYPFYDICYSGSAPEMVSPMAGAQMALNGAMVVLPTRKINFQWTPVISNCADRSVQFKYKFKLVKVLNGQNYRDAIKYNPTVFSAEVRNQTFMVFDTLRDIKVPLERGALYVAQVQAEQVKVSRTMDAFIIANGGKSQPMPFFWCYAPDGYYCELDDGEEGEEGDEVDGLTEWEGGVEEASELEEIIDEAIPDEQMIVLVPQRHYVKSDGYYTIPMGDDLEVGFMPIRHESLKDVSYTIELYDYIEGDVDSITSYEPQLYEEIEVPESYDMDSRELINHTLAGWGTAMDQGSLYYLQLSSHFAVDYWEYLIADTNFYVNGLWAEHKHDTVSRDFIEDDLTYSEGVFFQWGDDPKAPAFTTPQWKSPVDRTGDDIHDPANYELPTSVPEVKMFNTVAWTPVKDVADGDHVDYEVNVYELKSGQTLEEAVSENEVLVSRVVTDANKISEDDTKFFHVFSSGKTYVMTLSIAVYGESDVTYHFENGVEAIPVVFKVLK